jgi:hypothetical protein
MQTTLPFFLRTLNLEPDFKPAPVNGGNSNILLEHYNKTIGYYAKAVELDPQWATRWALPGPWTARTRPPGLNGLQAARENTKWGLAMRNLLAQTGEPTNKRGDSQSSR